jgi:peroxiredoxin
VKFDPARGLVEEVERKDTQGYGFNGKGTASTKLESVKTHDAGWSKQLAQQSDRYFRAKQAYEQKTTAAEKAPDAKASEKILKDAKAILTEVQLQIKDPIVKGLLADAIKQHDSMESYYTESAARRAKVIGHPAVEFEAKDLTGKTHTLKDFRGKVVVFDFWYRGCGWCMRAMPQVRQLAAEFRGQLVVVVGMNTDSNDADAKFVVDKMKLDYLTLKIDHKLSEKFGVQGFPTMVILDKEGKVHDLHVGYSPTLQQDVGEVVRQLLAKK